MLDVNSLPNQTEHDRVVILEACNGIIWAVINRGTDTLTADDIDDLHSAALEAANRAISDWTAIGGGSIATLIHRYVVQARRDFMRRRGESTGNSHNKQEAFEHGTVSLEGIEVEVDDGESRADALSVMEITIDMARNDGIIDEREYRVLRARRGGVIQREIAADLGVCPQRVHQIQGDAVRKIRARYKTAE